MLQRKVAVLLMPKQQRWIINPDVGFVDSLVSSGRFLEKDYRKAIEWMTIPLSFEEYTESTGRRFVIVGAKSVPGATAKSVFLCLKLAGADNIVVKAPTTDEYLMILNVVEKHKTDNVEVTILNDSSEELKLSPLWREALEKATDIVVFGGQNTIESFQDLENDKRRVWEHGPKFSFGVVNAYDLTPAIMRDICSDFYSFYGEGCLSPKFYVIIGEVGERLFQEFSDIMSAFFGDAVDEFRGKLPLTRKSELTQQFVSANYRAKYIREESIDSDKLFTTLYGDVRLVMVDSLNDLEPFIEKWHYNISTVASNPTDEVVNDFLEDYLITRICGIGTMQFPDFYEQFDLVDDFDIYVGYEEENEDEDR